MEPDQAHPLCEGRFGGPAIAAHSPQRVHTAPCVLPALWQKTIIRIKLTELTFQCRNI
ncbi:protein of unknown function [Cyanobium sp. NIES-981]|nr:protein of unknown function [Cyanobium sp. NIES-981]